MRASKLCPNDVWRSGRISSVKDSLPEPFHGLFNPILTQQAERGPDIRRFPSVGQKNSPWQRQYAPLKCIGSNDGLRIPL